MPTYVYGCDSCGYRFEQFQKFSDEPIRVCPQCQSSVRRIFQPAGIVFKGSGWHTTDYKRNGSDSSSTNGSEPKTDAPKEETKATEAASTSTSSATDTTKPAQAA